MNADKAMVLLGKQADSRPVLDLIEALNLGRRVDIPRGETEVHLNNLTEGVSLLFKTEAYVSHKHGVEFQTDAPVLMAIFLYGPNHKEFSEYKGELPGGLRLSEGKDMAKRRLGESEEYDEDFNSEFWSFPPNLRLFVDYSDDHQSIALAQYGIVLK